MKINEVEALVGITKKNIRFYEEKGLLSPRRSAENGYREYGSAEVETLRRIKLLRKLGLPVEDVRRMLAGELTVSDGVRRHMIALERERTNLEQAMTLCRIMQAMDIPASEMNAGELLAQMEALERDGASFGKALARDVRVRYIAPVAVTAAVLAVMIFTGALFIWAIRVEPVGAPPLWMVAVIELMLAAVGAGVVLALVQRIREIRKGEIDDAKNY